MGLPFEQQPHESARAFRAFTYYRDLGPERSLEKAYAGHSGEKDGKAPGQWNAWSKQFEWVRRAIAYDAHLDTALRKARERRQKRLEERQFDYRLKNQERLEDLVNQAMEVLRKVSATPVTDVIQQKEEEEESLTTASIKRTKSKTTVKAMKLSGYARLIQEVNETARQAVEGPDKAPVRRALAAADTKSGAGTPAVVPTLVFTAALPAEDEDGSAGD